MGTNRRLIEVPFIQKMVFVNEKIYIAFIITAAFPWSGYALHQSIKLIRHKKVKVNYGRYVATVENFIPKYKMWPIEKQNMINENVIGEVKIIARDIIMHKNYFDKETAFYMYSFYKILLNYLRKQDKKYYALDTCSYCGVCTNVCPCDNIELTKMGQGGTEIAKCVWRVFNIVLKRQYNGENIQQ